MYSWNKVKKDWVSSYLNDIFRYYRATKGDFYNQCVFSYGNLSLRNLDLVNSKGKNLPSGLYKYYAPTSNNIVDVENQMLWLADPVSFNDPYDCKLGYDEEKLEKKLMLNFAKEHKDNEELSADEYLSSDDLLEIRNSKIGEDDYFEDNYYHDVVYAILEKKSKQFKNKVNEFLKLKMKDAGNKVLQLNKSNVRVACFSGQNLITDVEKNIAMWAYYADNHKGFCVEYNIETFQNELSLSQDWNIHMDEVDYDYMNERLNIVIKSGLFPVKYNNNRVSISSKSLSDLLDGKKLASDFNKLIFKAYTRKSSAWIKEKEWRLLVDRFICEYYDNKIPFPYARKIYIGSKASDEVIERLRLIGEKLNIEVTMMTMDAKSYVLNRFGDYSDHEKWKQRKKNGTLFFR